MAVNKDLALPKTPIAHVACRPSTFAYLQPASQEKKEEVGSVCTCVCTHAHVCIFVCVCVCACVRARAARPPIRVGK